MDDTINVTAETHAAVGTLHDAVARLLSESREANGAMVALQRAGFGETDADEIVGNVFMHVIENGPDAYQGFTTPMGDWITP